MSYFLKGGVEGRLGIKAGLESNLLYFEMPMLGSQQLLLDFPDAVSIDEVEKVLVAVLVDDLR